MGEDEQLFGWRETVQDLNAPARGRSTSAIQVIRRFDDNPAGDNRGAQRCRLAARIARRLSGLWQRLAISCSNVKDVGGTETEYGLRVIIGGVRVAATDDR